MKILIGIMTCHKFNYDMTAIDQCMVLYRQSETVNVYGASVQTSDYVTPRAPYIRQTWWNNVPTHIGKKFFYGRPNIESSIPDSVCLDCKDDYASLPYKTIKMCQWALDRGYTNFFKADDDTYVYINRLLNSGFERHNWIGRYNGGDFVAGGPGYWLGQKAMEVLANSKVEKKEWAEDIWAAKRLNAAGIRPTFDSRYVDLRRGSLNKDTIAVCECNPELMVKLYQEEVSNH